MRFFLCALAIVMLIKVPNVDVDNVGLFFLSAGTFMALLQDFKKLLKN